VENDASFLELLYETICVEVSDDVFSIDEDDVISVDIDDLADVAVMAVVVVCGVVVSEKK